MPTVFLLAAAALSVDYGWQPLDGGGFEYIIQIEPELLDSLLAGESLRSDLPNYMRDVRSYRVQVGRGEVPRLGNPQATVAQAPPHRHDAREQMAEPPIEKPRDRWTPYGEAQQATPAKRNDQRYPEFNQRSDTTKPQLPAQASLPRPVDDDRPGRFLPEPGSAALVQQTSGYGVGESKTANSKGEAGPSGAKPPAVTAAEASKPWLPLTFTLLCLFVSLGGNAYLGLQWWTIRQRCQQLLRSRRMGKGPHTPTRGSESDREHTKEDEYAADDEDEEVRAISEDELPHGKRRRG